MLMLPPFDAISPEFVRLPLPALKLTLLAALRVPLLVIAPSAVARPSAPELEIVPEFVMLLTALSDKSRLLIVFENADKSELGRTDDMTPPFSLVMSVAEITPAVTCLDTSITEP